jgi:hypothetical protein
VNENITTPIPKPILDEEGFQRLLAAACVLQAHAEYRSPKAIVKVAPKSFAGGVVLQRRTPSRRTSPQRQALVKVRTLHGLTRRRFWRTTEAVVIGVVFCIMLGMSIHRLAALPSLAAMRGRNLTLSRNPEVASLSSESLATTQSSPDSNGDASDVSDQLVIHYRKPARSTSGSSPRLIFGQDPNVFTLDTVTRYGDDVTMWSLSSKNSRHKTPSR